jgi:hypothetical protein
MERGFGNGLCRFDVVFSCDNKNFVSEPVLKSKRREATSQIGRAFVRRNDDGDFRAAHELLPSSSSDYYTHGPEEDLQIEPHAPVVHIM